MPIKVSIVEEDRRIRESLATLINGTGNIRCVSSHAGGEGAMRQLTVEKPDVVLMDLHPANRSGLACVRQLKTLMPRVEILILTIYEDDELVFQTLLAGASGYLVKRASPGEILTAIEDVHNGASPMSGRIARSVIAYFHGLQRATPGRQLLAQQEQEVLALLAQGYREREIAAALSISFETVRADAKRIYEKLRSHSALHSPERGINLGEGVSL
jgi:DNA-binding NarL/FixJ family response regulator